MTTGYAFISIIALVCYVFLLLTFMAAKKSKLIHVFMLVFRYFLGNGNTGNQ